MVNWLKQLGIRWKKRGRKARGFTLAEALIAASIFTIVSVIGTTIFVNVIRIQNRIMLENQIYEDGRFLMERVAREIRHNTVDYEEYYREACREEHKAAGINCDTLTYGDYYGRYAAHFYNPGTDGGFGSVAVGGIVDKSSLDINTGENPYTDLGSDPDRATAVCDEDFYPNYTTTVCTDPSWHEHEQLFLINSDGDQKTMVASQLINLSPVEYGVAMLRLDGEDEDNDGIVESWHDDIAGEYRCAEDFNCPSPPFSIDPANPSMHIEESLESLTFPIYDGFVPITPLRTNVTSLKFFIAPLEDPRKAFAETDPAKGIQQQPHVTVLMTLQPAESELTDFAGELPTLTLQATVSSRVYNEVKSYLGENTDDPF